MAAALIVFIVIGGLGKNGLPIQPAAHGAGRSVASSEPIVNIQMVNGEVGWAAGQDGAVLRTTDGGATWLDVTPVDVPKAEPATAPTAPVFLLDDPQAAWLLDTRTDTVYRTVDGGQHWQKGTPPKLDVANDGGVSLSFASEQQGWLMVASGTHSQVAQLFQTSDGGLTWQSVSKTGSGAGALPYGGQIVFSRAVDGLGWLRPDFQANSNGMPPLYVTHDGGKTWASQDLALPVALLDLSSNQVHVQLPQFASFNIAKHGPATSGLEGVLPVTFMGGKSNTGLIYVTSDGGVSWTLAGSIANIGSSTQLVTAVADSLTLWAYVPDGNTLWATQDGGKDWTSFHPQPSLYDYQPAGGLPLMTQIDFVSGEQGWASVNGAILGTMDGGRTWTGQGQTATAGALKVAPENLTMFDASHGYGSTADHPVMVTNDGGVTWTDVTPQGLAADSGAIVKGYFIDARTGWVFSLRATQDVTVYGTTDGGRSWSKLATAPVKYGDGNMFIAFSDAQHGWFEDRSAGMGQLPGELLATKDGGLTWTRVAQSGSVNAAPGTPGVLPSGVLPFGGSLTAQSDGTLWLTGAQRATGGGPGYLWLFKSTDGGKSWSQMSLPVPAGHEEDATNVSDPTFIGKTGLLSVIYTGQQSASALYRSSDSGQTWSLQGTLNMGGWPVFANPLNGWQTDGQHLYRTTDGGRTWSTVNPDATLQKALAGRNISQIVISGSPGSTDGQRCLIVLESKGSSSVGRLLLATDDGGQTWSVTAGQASGGQ